MLQMAASSGLLDAKSNERGKDQGDGKATPHATCDTRHATNPDCSGSSQRGMRHHPNFIEVFGGVACRMGVVMLLCVLPRKPSQPPGSNSSH